MQPETYQNHLRELLTDLRARMADLQPENIQQTMHLAGLLRSRVSDPAIGEELRGYLKTLGRQYRDWRRAGKLP
jgi:hypothetical protein